jgi:hypothetical protein
VNFAAAGCIDLKPFAAVFGLWLAPAPVRGTPAARHQ